MKKPLRALQLFATILAIQSQSIHAAAWLGPQDDSELFIGTNNKLSSSITFILDTSLKNEGSNYGNPLVDRLPYDPGTVYSGPFNSAKIYWIYGVNGFPDTVANAYDNHKNNYFDPSINRCGSSLLSLSEVGFYDFSDSIMAWRFENATASVRNWYPLDGTSFTRDALHVDCLADTVNANNINPNAESGFPSIRTGNPYVPNRADSDRLFAGPIGLYTGNFMNWYYDDSASNNGSQSKLDIMKWVTATIIKAYKQTGSRFSIVKPVRYNAATHAACDITDARSACVSGGQIISDGYSAEPGKVDTLTPSTYNPLEGMLYEMMQFMTDSPPKFGTVLPGTDGSALDFSGNYQVVNPLQNCAVRSGHIIYVTSSLPAEDKAGRDAWGTLLGGGSLEAYVNHEEPSTWSGKTYSDNETNLRAIAEYLRKEKNITLEVIALPFQKQNGDSFSPDLYKNNTKDQQTLWTFRQTYDARSLLNAMKRGIRTGYVGKTASVVSPSLAASRFNRARTEDKIYIGAFEPSAYPAWNGNLFEADVKTWNPAAMTKSVTSGGYAASISAQTRNLLTNTGPGDSIVPFDYENLTSAQIDLLKDAGIPEAEHKESVGWVQGWETIEPETKQRGHRMGDVYHFTPVVLNYGIQKSGEDPVQRVVVGTNQGILHNFDTTAKSEKWAFMPKNLYHLIPRLRANMPGDSHPYGIDGKATLFRYDIDQDGNIEPADGDKLYLYFGFRRGGEDLVGGGTLEEQTNRTRMIALDVTNPDAPKFLFSVGGKGWWGNSTGVDSEDYRYQAQLWSDIQVTAIPQYFEMVNGKKIYKPVIVFTSGYDPIPFDMRPFVPNGYSNSPNALFIADAVTGELIRAFGHTGGNKLVTHAEFGVHRIAAAPTLWDSNQDGLTDRIYVPDLAATIWRIDLAGTELPPGRTWADAGTPAPGDWTIHRLANLGATDYVNENNWQTTHSRRVFVNLDVVRSRYKNSQGVTIPFDAILVGTGHVNDPNKLQLQDRFYMIRDGNIETKKFVESSPQYGEAQIPDVIGKDAMYDVTDNLVQDGASEIERANVELDIAAKKGWFINLEGSGEKVLARSVTINHVVYFTTFIPDPAQVDGCYVQKDFNTRLYAVKLQNGAAVFANFNGTGADLTKTDRWKDYGNIAVIGTLGVHIDENGEITILMPYGTKHETKQKLVTRPLSMFRRE